MKHILSAIDRVAAKGGNAKVAQLAIEADNPDVMWALKRCLDPMITYGVGKKTLTAVTKGKTQKSELAMPQAEAELLLSELQGRTLTGSRAKTELLRVFETYCPQSWEVLRRIITKDPRGGFSGKTLNEAVGRIEIEIFEVNLAHPYKEKSIKSWPVKTEIKFDGVRAICIADLEKRTAVFLSRTGKEFYAFRTLAGDVIKMLEAGLRARTGRVLFDGEVITGDFLKTVSEVRRKKFDARDAIFNVFEFMTENEFKKGCALEEARRRDRTESLFAKSAAALGQEQFEALAIALTEQELVHSHAEVMAKFKERFDQGFEGIIVKQPGAFYERKRGYGYLKLKDEVETAGEVDLKIIGVYPGEEGTKYEHMAGGVIVDFNGVEVRIGGGFSDRQRAEIWADYTNTVVELVTQSWEEELDEMVTVVTKVKPSGQSVISRLVEVKYHEITEYGSMRHPRFHRFRDLLKKGELV